MPTSTKAGRKAGTIDRRLHQKARGRFTCWCKVIRYLIICRDITVVVAFCGIAMKGGENHITCADWVSIFVSEDFIEKLKRVAVSDIALEIHVKRKNLRKV